ncbi:MAG: glycoside hydrolase family 3 protein [Pseudomonadales bacterium]
MTTRLDDPTIKQKVDALLSQMSLDQKIGQMTQAERATCSPQDVKAYHLGSVFSGGGSSPADNRPADWVAMNDAYWAASMEADEHHLAIPIIYGLDAIHGNNNVLGATVFPHNIGLGAANSPELVERIAEITARETLATGVDWTFAPTLAVSRNDHWGRTYESYSEDPAIVSSYAAPFVRGLQGDLDDSGLIACVKHWVGDGGSTNGIDQGNTAISLNELESIHIAPYYAAIEQGVLTVMASYSSWNGDKCHSHKYLISDILKNDMSFKGIVISDWDGIDTLAQDYYDAVKLAVNAGIDMFMVPENWQSFISILRTHVQQGSVPISRINDAVSRILTVKFAYGLFDKPRPRARPWSNHPSFGCKAHREVAREAVRKSLILLKNEHKQLPLDKQARIFVAGKSAHNRGYQCGGFTVAWQGCSDNEVIEDGTSIWEGIKQQASNAVLSCDEFGADADADQHDIAIVVIGERPYAEGLGDIRDGNNAIVEAGSQIKGQMQVLDPYAKTLEHAISHPEDLKTIKNIRQKGIPVIAILVSGRPLVINQELDEVASLVAAWLPGSEGQGIADVLFGDYDFEGKLSFSWPKNSATNMNIGDPAYDPLFPYGYGLNYSSVS